MCKIPKEYKYNRKALLIQIVVGLFLFTVKVWEVVELRMDGEDVSGLDWFMLIIWLLVLVLGAAELIWRKRKKVNKPVNESIEESISG